MQARPVAASKDGLRKRVMAPTSTKSFAVHVTLALALLAAGWPLSAQNATVAGEVSLPYPTLTNLSIEWKIEGDDNLNSVVYVQYRKAGEQQWRQAMPLRRVPAGESRGTTPIFRWENKHSGSVFDLQPNTVYEIRLRLVDPDGGDEERIVQARTRPVPRAPADATVRRAGPGQLDQAHPGEIILLEPGEYGQFVAPRDGTPDRPIVYRSEDGGAVFESISLSGRKYVYLEGLTVRSEGTAINLNNTEGCVVRRCRIRAVYGIRASSPPGARNAYIADNVIEGPTPWASAAMGANGDNVGEGIQITGPGNVIAYNRVSGYRDGISLMEDSRAYEQVSVDIYGNDISVGADDGIEADFCFHNCRILRNRLTNCFTGLSSQPGLGGPTYFIRNVMYNLTYVPFKLHRFSQGDVILHNTTVKVGDGMACFSSEPFDYALFRNNLSIGGPPGEQRYGNYSAGIGLAANMSNPGPHCDFDYDAVGTLATPFRARIGRLDFFQVEPHGMKVEFEEVFENVEFPLPALPEREPADLRPRPGSAVVDAALRLPNINDDFLGEGPDIGAYEAGQPLPHYGPRPEWLDEETQLQEVARLGLTPRQPVLSRLAATWLLQRPPFASSCRPSWRPLQ